jgi:hypothetical protein
MCTLSASEVRVGIRHDAATEPFARVDGDSNVSVSVESPDCDMPCNVCARAALTFNEYRDMLNVSTKLLNRTIACGLLRRFDDVVAGDFA